MQDAEARAMRREILDEVGVLLRDHLAAEEWGRALVEAIRGDDGEPIVAGIDVEDIVGDEARIDAVFADEAMRPLLPVIAKATEALCELAGVELDDVGGGTFLRRADGSFEWLPGRVHAPSQSFERAWDEVVARLDAKQRALEERLHLSRHQRVEVDVERERIVFASPASGAAAPSVPSVLGRATPIGTYSLASRAWGWGGYNENLPERVRRASAALVDEILERDMWELSTPAFAVDDATAWALAALVCDRAAGESVYRSRTDGGYVFLLLRDMREVAGD
jgi:hypothetical protein